jgi:A/G-specific adenine glycosylase
MVSWTEVIPRASHPGEPDASGLLPTLRSGFYEGSRARPEPSGSLLGMQDMVLAWYDRNRRDLPWRHTHDPYAILVSEVMLQQTQVARVVPRYLAWLERWPTVESLAAATPAEVITAWSGLGYNRRAVLLHRCAVSVSALGGFPREPRELERLPGIGPYTAAAIACFAFGAQIAAPDTNARRVLGRAFGDPPPAPPPGQAYAWNQALFDLGREVCIARTPRCGACPLASGCPSRGMTYAPLRRQSRFEGSFRQRRARLLRAIAAAGALPDADADAEALVSLVRDGLAEVSGGHARLPE